MSERLFFGAVSQKPEVTDAHEAIGPDMEQEAAGKLLGIQSHRLFLIGVFSISVAHGHFSVLDFNQEEKVRVPFNPSLGRSDGGIKRVGLKRGAAPTLRLCGL